MNVSEKLKELKSKFEALMTALREAPDSDSRRCLLEDLNVFQIVHCDEMKQW